MLDIFLIAVICVIIIDLSGITSSIKSGIKRLITKGKMSDPNYSLKPFDCSFCCTFWFSLIYLLLNHSFSLWMVTWILIVCLLTPVIKDILVIFRDVLLYILSKIYEGIQ